MPAIMSIACDSQMPTSKVRSGCSTTTLSSPVPPGIAAVQVTVLLSMSQAAVGLYGEREVEAAPGVGDQQEGVVGGGDDAVGEGDVLGDDLLLARKREVPDLLVGRVGEVAVVTQDDQVVVGAELGDQYAAGPVETRTLA